jgi:hypothetical protein
MLIPPARPHGAHATLGQREHRPRSLRIDTQFARRTGVWCLYMETALETLVALIIVFGGVPVAIQRWASAVPAFDRWFRRRFPRVGRQLPSVPEELTNPEVEQVAAIVRVRISEILPRDSFEVQAAPGGFNIFGVGPARGFVFGTTPAMFWYDGSPSTGRVERYLEFLGTRLQRFVSNALGTPWPAAGAVARVHDRDGVISLWWSSAGDSTPVLRIRPIALADLTVNAASEDGGSSGTTHGQPGVVGDSSE